MAEVRDFDAEFDYSNKEGLAFKLGGEEFHTKPIAPPKAFMELSTRKGLDSAVGFMMDVLVPEDREKLQAIIDDPDILISAHQLDHIAAWIIQETSGRPTEQPASSGSGGGKNSRSLKAVSRSRGKTSA